MSCWKVNNKHVSLQTLFNRIDKSKYNYFFYTDREYVTPSITNRKIDIRIPSFKPTGFWFSVKSDYYRHNENMPSINTEKNLLYGFNVKPDTKIFVIDTYSKILEINDKYGIYVKSRPNSSPSGYTIIDWKKMQKDYAFEMVIFKNFDKIKNKLLKMMIKQPILLDKFLWWLMLDGCSGIVSNMNVITDIELFAKCIPRER